MSKYIVFLLDNNKWKQIRVTENIKVAIELCKQNINNGYHCNVETEFGHYIYGTK